MSGADTSKKDLFGRYGGGARAGKHGRVLPYFEKQIDRDCVIHSLNNAFGAHVIDKERVLQYIEDQVQADIERRTRQIDITPGQRRAMEKSVRQTYMTDGSYFTADVVWRAAKEDGVYDFYVRIPGMMTPYMGEYYDMPEEFKGRPVVILGKKGKSRHALAIRDGYIIDSEAKGPVPYSPRALLRTMTNVFAAYAFYGRGDKVETGRPNGVSFDTHRP